MRNKTGMALMATALVFGSMSTYADGTDTSAIKAQVKPIIMSFAGNLKSELKQAMMAGGPAQGIAACNVKAPELTEQAAQAGWQVARTSLKWRNANNKPTQWEQAQLQEFERRLANAEPAKQLWAVQETDTQIRVMKAIVTQPACLACHGESIAPSLKTKLTELYPNDRATGYKVGEVRGAFSLTKHKF